jgi:hypothetical protein
LFPDDMKRIVFKNKSGHFSLQGYKSGHLHVMWEKWGENECSFTWSIRGYLLFTSTCTFAWSLSGIIRSHNETCQME